MLMRRSATIKTIAIVALGASISAENQAIGCETEQQCKSAESRAEAIAVLRGAAAASTPQALAYRASSKDEHVAFDAPNKLDNAQTPPRESQRGRGDQMSLPEKQSLFYRRGDFSALGAPGVPHSANQFGDYVSAEMNGETFVSAEKAARLTWIVQNMPSDYAHSIYRDAVGWETLAQVGANCFPCRVYGGHIQVNNLNAAAGYFGGGLEIAMNNFGVAEPRWGTPTSNVGLSLVARGGFTTGALAITSVAGASFFDGIFFSPQSVRNAAVRFGSGDAEWRADGTLRVGRPIDHAAVPRAAYSAHNFSGYDFSAFKSNHGNASARFAGTDAAAREFLTFVYHAAKAVSIGYDNADRQFKISGKEDIDGAVYDQWDDSGNQTKFGSLTFSMKRPIIYMGDAGIGAPGPGSSGEKIQILGRASSVSAGDYAVGAEQGFLWTNSGGGFKWYSNSGLVATLSRTGSLSLDRIVTSGPMLHASSAPLANGAAQSAGTLNNAPIPGNPTKWIAIDDAGTIRHIPTW